MYSRYESNGYKFNSRSAMAEYEMDHRDCDWGPGPQASNYGGYKEDSSSNRYEQDTSSYQSSYYKRYPSDKKYYHNKREEFDILYETEKAYLLLDNNDNEFWCPKSLIIDTIRIKNVISTRVWKGVSRDKVNLI